MITVNDVWPLQHLPTMLLEHYATNSIRLDDDDDGDFDLMLRLLHRCPSTNWALCPMPYGHCVEQRLLRSKMSVMDMAHTRWTDVVIIVRVSVVTSGI